ncbi:tenascin-like isoform X5 [Protopterus annectens]|uniref:tenascin-like isoform X5 n=1 Tax=Protopterus annectens TaxID=7888 RepID=UPI001CFA79BC|nr:tenascin-like isoform X5 [Protopterus annectens]
MGLFWGLVILLFIETIEEAKGGVYIKRFRQRRALLANATSEDPIVFNHVYNIRMPDCESCSADVSAPSIFEASDDPKEHKYEHNIQGRNQVVFTHRINIPPQACGCSNDKDIEVLLSRLEALESQVSTLRDQCSNTGCCDGALAGKRQTDIRILCNGHGTFDSTKCNCDCEKGWTGPTCSDPECPSNCNKHGKCINGRCVCDTGFTGADCSETECPDDCNDQGRCIDGKCVCFVGYSGPRCDIKICPDNCNNRGRCVEGTCICNTGFSGPSCNVSVCPDNCSNKGRCINGKCVCYSGFSGPACNFKTCPNNCNNNGRCINGKCVCHTGFAGPSCSTKVCPNNCNNNGRCVNGKCECNVGFIGPSCGTRTCPDNCNNNGRCVDGKCECNVGFSGPSCGTRTCPDNCNNNGRCVDGKCECNIGFSGPSCGTRTCPDNCNNNGRCVDGRCECNVGFTGPSCASRTCPDNCNNNGHCVDGRCECNVGFTGPSCASRTCPNNCNNNGRCIDGKCECIIGFTGPSCATRNCPHNCNNNGRCVDGKCECNVGYTGPICATRTCPDNCNKNGRCVDGKCECNVGFTGPSCANKTCPGNCNNRGRCENGKCFCETGFSGEDCSTQCPKKCSSKGSCINGVCICFPGYTGSDCSKQSCPRNCNNRGRCINGQCICIKGFVGSDCSMKACPNDCSNRGKCLNGTCLCEEGFSGHDCSKGIPTVENLQVRNIQDTSVMLEWTKPRIAVDGYKISFRPMDNDEGFISIRINETVRRFTQTGLQPGKEYTVTVQAEKNQKYGPASTKSIVTLIDSVQNLRVTGVSNNSISLKWDKSAADVERYIISYVSPTGKKGHLEVSSEADTAVLRNLEPGVRYLITVVAEMGSEQSKPARTNASTVPLKDHSKPTNMGSLTVKGVTNNSFSLTWKALKGAFDSFIVQYEESEGPSPQAQEISIPGNLRTAIIRGLKPDTEYKVHVYGVRGNQRTQPLTAVTITEKALERPVLDSLSVSDVTENSMRLTWTVKKGILDSLIIQYRDSQNETHRETISGDLLTTVISGLKPSQEYVFNVTGISGGRSTGTQLARGKTASSAIAHERVEKFGHLSISDVTEDSFHVRWMAQVRAFDSFIVLYRDSAGISASQQKKVPGNLRTTVIKGLQPSTKYNVTLYGVHRGKRSVPQKAAAITTPSSPKGLTFTDIQDTSVTVNWLLPAENVDRIKVSYTTVPDGEPQNIIVEGKRNKGVLTGLTPASKYEVSVISMRGFDESEPLSGVVMTLPDSPSNLRAVNVTETTALLHWRPALAPVDNYMVTYNTKNAPEATRTTSGNTVEVQLSDLKHNTEYTVKVYSVKEANRSRPAVTVFTTAADAIKDLWVTEVSPHSAVLSWNAPKVPVSGYVLSYETATGKRKTVNVISSPTSYNLTDLHPGTKYNVHLQAVRGGNRMPSVDASFTTVLDSPSNLRAVNVSDTTALLHWTPALAAVDNYVVTYNAKNAPEVIRSVSGNTAELQLSGLKVSTEYSVKVHSAKGTNESQPAFTVFTTAADAPKDLKASAVSPRGAVISWKPPKAPVSSYMLSYETAAGESKGVNVNASATVYKLTGLYPATKYNIHLHAVRGGSRMAPINTSFTTVRVRYPFPKDCSQEMLNGLTESGLTTVYMNGDRTKPFQVYCDMETDGGGWLVLQRRMNGKTDFWRGWKEYAEGFGDPREEFWLGNEKIHNLTKQNRYKLRIDLRAQAESAYAEYDDFRIDNATKYYKLHLGKYSGNAGKDCTVGYT